MKKSLILAAVCYISGLSVNVANAQTNGGPVTPAPKGTFTIVVMSDTQDYLGKGTKIQPGSQDSLSNPVFDSQTNWISKNIKQQNIVFVSHGGDIVDKDNPEQWKLAQHFMDRFQGVVPYGIVLGNHDIKSDGNSSLFQQYFPASRFKDFPWYGGYFKGQDQHPEISGNNSDSYQLFSAEGVKMIILHLECNAPDDVLHWADSILDKYKDRVAMVTTHMYLGIVQPAVKSRDYQTKPLGMMLWTKRHEALGNNAQQMWDKCFKKHENLQFIFCGDQSGANAIYLRNVGDHGNVVHALLSDYSGGKHGGIRLYRFSPAKNEVQVMSYDTMDEQIEITTAIVPDAKQHNFTLPVKLK
jgi:hypothetical protein